MNRQDLRMGRTGRAIAGGALLIAAAVGSPALATAADLCIRFPFQTIVARDIKIPKPDNCKPVLGHVSGFAGKSPTVSGSACTNSVGDRANLSIVEHLVGPDLELARTDYFIQIALPARTGTALLKSEGFASLTFPVAIVPCPDDARRMD
jgi:hypothetical protein